MLLLFLLERKMQGNVYIRTFSNITYVRVLYDTTTCMTLATSKFQKKLSTD